MGACGAITKENMCTYSRLELHSEAGILGFSVVELFGTAPETQTELELIVLFFQRDPQLRSSARNTMSGKDRNWSRLRGTCGDLYAGSG
jgi:hypothetical protein